eukprot:TRINITY_DN9390_c0_g1_i1.p1 TRINITY_DN9390_c0_g1~~TRINITY_DN9390_c0_g1_i1.p1  ORF type:complete len:130 (+),score=74.94 TRINITY_DN9390_c0_g1_i1:57-446(+)
MASKENEPVVVNVTWEDQKRICNFGRLHKRQVDVKDEIELLKTRLEHISDAETEIYVADDVKFALGESFVAMDCDQVDTLLVDSKEAAEKNLETLENEMTAIAAAMKTMKGELYAKFGNAIYLETEDKE